jgi:hypothetical protein
MTPVKREQFKVISAREVTHLPTGASFSVYEYEDPTVDPCSTVSINWSRAGDVLPNGEDYDRNEVGRIACEILRELARKRVQAD